MADKCYFCGLNQPEGRVARPVEKEKVMTKLIKYLLLWMFCLEAALPAAGAPRPELPIPAIPNAPTPEEQVRLKKYLYQRLSYARTPSDSVMILYNLYDLGPKSESREIIFKIYDIAVRTGDEIIELDMLRQWAFYYSEDEKMLLRCLKLAKEKAKSGTDLAKETLLFVEIENIMREIGHSVIQDAPIENRLNGLIARYISNPPTDKWECFKALFTICVYMGNLGEGQMMEHYTVKLNDALSELPLTTGQVRNVVYSRNAVSFTNFGLYRQALDSDRRLLRTIDSMESHYRRDGRIYRNLDNSRYNIYRRMLANSAGLRRPEVDRIWEAIQEIAGRNTDIAADMKADTRAEIYYLMATEQYAKAVPIILHRLTNNSRPLPFREILYNALITAAEKTGDKDVLLEAYRVYADMLMARLKNRQAESIRELEIAYSVNDFKNETSEMEAQLNRRELVMTRIVSFCAVLIAILLATTALVLWRQKKRVAKSSVTIERINASLVEERDKLEQLKTELEQARDEANTSDKLKTEFINNMSHEIQTPLQSISECSQLIVDCIPDDKRKFLDRFGRTIELNVALMQRLINDVLDTASLESKQLSISRMAEPVESICTFVTDSVAESFRQDVKLEYELSEDVRHIVLVTDRQRVSQVLINLLENAVKFTERGTVRLSVEADREAGEIRFRVSDTGPGIRKGMEEVIFERFRKLDPSSQGVGLGLYIARMIARILGGDVRVDTSYRGGASFIFTLPLDD